MRTFGSFLVWVVLVGWLLLGTVFGAIGSVMAASNPQGGMEVGVLTGIGIGIVLFIAKRPKVKVTMSQGDKLTYEDLRKRASGSD